MRYTRLLPVAALAASGLFPAAAPAQDVAEAQLAGVSNNVKHVMNIKHRISKVDGAQAAGNAGSDIEFISRDVTGLPQALARDVSGVRDFALAGSLSAGMQVYDITDPATTELVAVYDCKLAQGDIQVFERDGKQLATYTADYDAVTTSKCYKDAAKAGYAMGNNLGTFIADFTNPYAPTTVSFINITKGSHNQTVHPSGQYLYNSNNELTGGIGKLEVIDIQDVTKPKQVYTLDLGTGIDSHDVTFRADGNRAYSAAINHSLVFDTSNPAEPKILGRIFDGSSTIHHQAEPITVDTPAGKRELLVVTDELGGGSYGSTCPGGAIHVFDITGPLENAPVKVGVFDAPHLKPAGPVGGSAMGCTSHVLRFHPKEKVMTIAWYNLGVHVVDISTMLGLSVGATPAASTSAAMGMKEIGWAWFDDSNTWSVKTNKINADGSMALFANDINRGLDVFSFTRGATGAEDAAAPAWAFHTPKAFETLKAANLAKSGKSLADLIPLCMRGGI